MAIPIVKKFNSFTWQFSEGSPSELFAAAAKELSLPGVMLTPFATDIARDSSGKYVLTLYFSQTVTATTE